MFDPSAYYRFELPSGTVHMRSGERVLVLDSEVVGPLISSAVRQGDLTSIRSLGRKVGEQASRSLFDGQTAGDLDTVPPEELLSHAGGVLGMLGWGRLGFERWGPALVAVIEDAPRLDEDRLGLAALLGGLFSRLAEREVACVPMAPEGHYIIVDPQIAEQVWGWARSGMSLGEIVAQLEPGLETNPDPAGADSGAEA